MKNFSNTYKCLVLFAIVFTSCKDEGTDSISDINLSTMENFIGKYYEVDIQDSNLYISLINAPIITRERKKGLALFSYEQYASICALLIINKNTLNSTKNINVQITDTNVVSDFSYKTDDLRKINELCEKAVRFSDEIVNNGLEGAKGFFSEEILKMSTDSFNNYFHSRYFSYGPFVSYNLLGFKISERQNVGIFTEYALNDGRRQTYVLVYELNGNKKIIDIQIPDPAPNTNY